MCDVEAMLEGFALTCLAQGVQDSRFPASARTGPVVTRTSSAGMIRLRRTEGLVIDSPQDEGCPPSLKSPLIPLCQRGTEGVERRFSKEGPLATRSTRRGMRCEVAEATAVVIQ